MYKAIHHDGRKPLVDIASYLQRHDIVYRRPSLEPFEGLPLGDGRLGGLLSHTANGLAMQVNHTDVIDFGPDGNMQAWAWEAEERNTAPVACGTVAIQSALPCFDWVYLKEYEERLSLADGCVYGRAVTPFSRVEWKAYAANGQGALVFKVDAWQRHEAQMDALDHAQDILDGRCYPGRLAPAPIRTKVERISGPDATRSYTVLNLVMMFFIFCFVGWIWEVTLAFITEGMFVNRGTLHGPWLPIYGTGGIAILVLLKKLRSRPALEFVAAMALCGAIEYFSSWYLEVTHDGQRWWDYTGYFLNLNGRICAEGLLTFGLGGLAIVYLLAPALDDLLRRANVRVLTVVAAVLLAPIAATRSIRRSIPTPAPASPTTRARTPYPRPRSTPPFRRFRYCRADQAAGCVASVAVMRPVLQRGDAVPHASSDSMHAVPE